MQEKTKEELTSIMFDVRVDRAVSVTQSIMGEFKSIYKFPHASNFIVAGIKAAHMLALEYQTTFVQRPNWEILKGLVKQKLGTAMINGNIIVVDSVEAKNLILLCFPEGEIGIADHIFTHDEILAGNRKLPEFDNVYIIESKTSPLFNDVYANLLLNIIPADDLSHTDTVFVVFKA